MEKEAAVAGGDRDRVAVNDMALAGLRHSRFAVWPANRCRMAMMKEEVCLL